LSFQKAVGNPRPADGLHLFLGSLCRVAALSVAFAAADSNKNQKSNIKSLPRQGDGLGDWSSCKVMLPSWNYIIFLPPTHPGIANSQDHDSETQLISLPALG
jgi:hypothetical protein